MRPAVMFIHGAFSQPAHFAGWIHRFEAAGNCPVSAIFVVGEDGDLYP